MSVEYWAIKRPTGGINVYFMGYSREDAIRRFRDCMASNGWAKSWEFFEKEGYAAVMVNLKENTN